MPSPKTTKRRKQGSAVPTEKNLMRQPVKTARQSPKESTVRTACRFEGCSLPRVARSLYCASHRESELKTLHQRCWADPKKTGSGII